MYGCAIVIGYGVLSFRYIHVTGLVTLWFCCSWRVYLLGLKLFNCLFVIAPYQRTLSSHPIIPNMCMWLVWWSLIVLSMVTAKTWCDRKLYDQKTSMKVCLWLGGSPFFPNCSGSKMINVQLRIQLEGHDGHLFIQVCCFCVYCMFCISGGMDQLPQGGPAIHKQTWYQLRAPLFPPMANTVVSVNLFPPQNSCT